MHDQSLRIDRMDQAARALVAQQLRPWGCVVLVWYPFLRWWLASVHEQWATIFIAALTTVPTVMALLRASGTLLAVGFTAIVTGTAFGLLTLPRAHAWYDQGAHSLLSLVWVWMGFWLVKKGKPLASLSGTNWEPELAQVEYWLALLHRKGKDDNVIEIPESTFTWGNRTHRILNAHYCWAMATFKAGKEDDPPLDYRVRPPSAITLFEEPGGWLAASVNGKLIGRRRKPAA